MLSIDLKCHRKIIIRRLEDYYARKDIGYGFSVAYFLANDIECLVFLI